MVPMDNDSGAGSPEQYIGGLIRYGSRPLYDSERDFLEGVRARHRKAVPLLGWMTAVCVVGLVVDGLLFLLGDYEGSAILTLFGLLIGVPAGWFTFRSKSRLRLLDRELEFGWVDAYGEPAEWNRREGIPDHTERLIHSPITRRILWIDGKHHENVYESPTIVAKPPEAYHNLASSDWFDDRQPAFRRLDPSELEELKTHLTHRRFQIALGFAGVAALVALALILAIARQFPPGGIVLAVFSLPAIPVGWRAWKQYRELRLCVESGRVGMVKEPTDDGEIIVEFLEGSGVVWTIAGAAHPWRGVRGAQ